LYAAAIYQYDNLKKRSLVEIVLVTAMALVLVTNGPGYADQALLARTEAN
jgi:hypothetical protein